MRRVIFVTTEYDPVLPGGAGTVVGELSRRLAADGRDVEVVLVADLATGLPEVPGVQVHHVEPAPVDEEAPTPHLALSRDAAHGLTQLGVGSDDLVEFIDFWGLAFWSLTRRDRLGLEQTPIAVRFHGPMDLIYEVSELELAQDDRLLEASSLRLADIVIVPSDPIGYLAREHYGIEPDRIVLGEPPVPEVRRVAHIPRPGPRFIALGTPSEVKGSTDFLEAVLPLLETHPDVTVGFVGGPGWSTSAGKPMESVLRQMTPVALRSRVEFRGRVARDDLGDELADAWAVVIPSRFETFSLAAHELRRMGLPVVLGDLPAFQAHFSTETGALVFDGTIIGLRGALASLIDEPEIMRGLASAPAPILRDPLQPYRGEIPPPRHPRSQAGLATATLVSLNRIVGADRSTSRFANTAKVVLRALPEPVAKAAIRVLPQGLKERFRGLASWPAEIERRERDLRFKRIDERIEGGDFPDLKDPRVTVVVPCFNQGEFLREALLSVFEQTYSSFEIVVVDDGSTDPKTKQVLDSLHHPRTRVVHQDNKGLPGARNAGIEMARGELLVPLDADDQLRPRFLEKLVGALDAEPGAGFAHCWAELFGNVSALFATRPFNPYWITQLDSVIGCVVMRKEACQAVGGYDETMVGLPEDWELWVRMTKRGWGEVLVPEPLFRYRKHGVTLGVEGEVNFERGKRALEERHPDIYNQMAGDELRLRSYPLVSVVGDNNPAPEIAEQVPDITGLSATWGKYVVDVRGANQVGEATLLALAEALEASPDISIAQTTGQPPLQMIRRWNLHDPEAEPSGTITIDDPTRGTGRNGLNEIPRSGWSIPEDLRSKWDSVQRQRPEEAWQITVHDHR